MPPAESDADREWRTKSTAAFANGWWPLEAAVVWIATGDRPAASAVALSPRSWLPYVNAKAELKSMYAEDRRRVFRPEARSAPDPIAWALDEVRRLLECGGSARGLKDTAASLAREAKLTPIPRSFWKTAKLRDADGIVAATSRGKHRWANIEVPRELVLSRWPVKRGRPIGTSPTQRADAVTFDLYREALRSGAHPLPTIGEVGWRANRQLEAAGEVARASTRSAARVVRAVEARAEKEGVDPGEIKARKPRQRGRRGARNTLKRSG